jgi:hypothetical protein
MAPGPLFGSVRKITPSAAEVLKNRRDRIKTKLDTKFFEPAVLIRELRSAPIQGKH